MLFPTLTNVLKQGAKLNRVDPLRNGNMLCFPGVGELIVAGDLHNHERNFERIKTVADLGASKDRHVILQELIHGGAIGQDGADRSLEMLLEAIEWADKYPGQVHFLLANHDLAQVQGQAIMKEGYDLTERFNRYFESKAGVFLENAEGAFGDFVYSMPLAGITLTGVLLSHSLPGPRELAGFDSSILRRELADEDYSRTGSVYQLIWGRNQSQEVLNALSKAWWSELFVCGHQAQDQGTGRIGDRMVILDSSHNHGAYLEMDLARQYTMEGLMACADPLASVA